MSKHNLGQTVHLRSGGPDMTVASIKTEPYEIYHCTWFDKEGKYNTCEFDVHEIMNGKDAPVGFAKPTTREI